MRDKAEIFALRHRAQTELERWTHRTCWMGQAEATYSRLAKYRGFLRLLAVS